MVPSTMGVSGAHNDASSLGHPQDRWQHIYVWHHHGDHETGHEEIIEVEEVNRVERTKKRLVSKVKVNPAVLRNFIVYISGQKHANVSLYVQDVMKTAKYHKWCFDQIVGVMAENKSLTTEVDRLRSKLENGKSERAAWEEQQIDISRQLIEKERERSGKRSRYGDKSL
jgi:ribonuclease BN (tRNA processing enzyme)